MRKRINFDVFKMNQIKIQKNPNYLQELLYKTSYELINDMLCDIKRPFKNICIHGFHPQLMIDHLLAHKQNYQKNQAKTDNLKTSEISIPKITIVDYLDLYSQKNDLNQNLKIDLIKIQNSDQFPPQQEQFDLIISGLQLNHANSQEKILQKYLRALKPDGALIGCAMVQGTLSELYWSYLMAQNQRYGGLSPKVMNFPSLGQLGSILTSTHFHLSTVLNREYQLQFQSPIDLLKALQAIGQNNYLKGRRKGVYKDLLISMYALYQSEYSVLNSEQNSNRILSSLVLAPFLGWKYSPDQPKPLRRGQHGDTIDFVDQLRKYDPQLQHFKISENSQEIQTIKPNSNQKTDGDK